MQVYQASGNLDSRSWPALVGFGLGGALSVGLLAGIITQFIDLVIVFPLAMGMGVGIAIKQGARLGHCRNLAAVTVVAFAMGLLCYGVKLYTNYRTSRSEVLVLIKADIQKRVAEEKKSDASFKEPTAADVDRIADEVYREVLVQKTGSSGFMGWFKMLLQSGISLSHGSGSSGGLNLGYVGTLILLLIEAILVGFMAYSAGLEQMKEPYCEKCFRWAELVWRGVTNLKTLGGVAETVTNLTPASEPPAGLLAALPPADESGEHGRVELRLCESCKEGYLSGFAMTPRADGKGLDTAAVFENLVCPPQLVLTMRRPAGAGEAGSDSGRPPTGPAPRLNLPSMSAGRPPVSGPARPSATPARPAGPPPSRPDTPPSK